jgi:hypothetical protein
MGTKERTEMSTDNDDQCLLFGAAKICPRNPHITTNEFCERCVENDQARSGKRKRK